MIVNEYKGSVMSDDLNETEKGNAQEVKPGSDFEKRRKLLLGAASVTPVLMTISTKPAWGAVGGLCGVSGNLSGNLSNSEIIDQCEYNILSPGGNGQISSGNWGPYIYDDLGGITDVEIGDTEGLNEYNIWTLLRTTVHIQQVITDFGDKKPLKDMVDDGTATEFITNMTIAQFFDENNKTSSWTWLSRAIQAMVNAEIWDRLVEIYNSESGGTEDEKYLKFVNCGFYFPVPDADGSPSYDMDVSTADWVAGEFLNDHTFFADFIKDDFENMNC